jgi:hypothetical protein
MPSRIVPVDCVIAEKPRSLKREWACRMGRWALAPVELVCGYGHFIACCGCGCRYGNPITPIIEQETYDDVYPDENSKSCAWFMSTIAGAVRSVCCVVTCVGCCGTVCDPKNTCSLVKYD